MLHFLHDGCFFQEIFQSHGVFLQDTNQYETSYTRFITGINPRSWNKLTMDQCPSTFPSVLIPPYPAYFHTFPTIYASNTLQASNTNQKRL
jgi:hypothetical protein